MGGWPFPGATLPSSKVRQHIGTDANVRSNNALGGAASILKANMSAIAPVLLRNQPDREGRLRDCPDGRTRSRSCHPRIPIDFVLPGSMQSRIKWAQ